MANHSTHRTGPTPKDITSVRASDNRLQTHLNPSVSVSELMTLIDFTLSNARRFYSSMGNPSDTEGLTTPKMSPLTAQCP